jgi:hypothetical protein
LGVRTFAKRIIDARTCGCAGSGSF